MRRPRLDCIAAEAQQAEQRAARLANISETVTKLARMRLATTIYEAVLDGHESFELDTIGADLAYLLGAILKDDKIDAFRAMHERPMLRNLLRTLDASHPVWRHVNFDVEDEPEDPSLKPF